MLLHLADRLVDVGRQRPQARHDVLVVGHRRGRHLIDDLEDLVVHAVICDTSEVAARYGSESI